MDDKRCSRCGVAKPRTEFYPNRRWRDGLHPYCKPCLLTYQRDRRFAKLDAADPNRRRWSRRFVRHDYFNEIDRPVKAYLLGILAADGNVLEVPRRVTLELNAKDEELTRLFRDEVAPTVRIRRRPPRGHAGEQSVIAVTSPGLVSGLAQWGVVPRKTWSYVWPANLSRGMWRPYLLGHFDGDGFTTLSRSWGAYVYPRWGILGTRSFVESVCDYVCTELGIARRGVHEKTGVWQFCVTGRDALSVDQWLHDGWSFGLSRKRLTGRIAAA